MIASLLVLSALPQTETIEIWRGASLGPGRLPYYAVEDTTLDAQQELPQGGSPFLTGGVGRTLLIRFGNLERVIGPNRQIRSARLELKLAAGARAVMSSAMEILEDWEEGPAQVVTFGRPMPSSQSSWAATHKFRRTGAKPVEWQQSGALGPRDSRPIENAKLTPFGENTVVIEGLTEVLKRQTTNWVLAGGIGLKFTEPVEFFSSNAPASRPKLILEVGPAPTPAVSLTVSRTGFTPVPKTTKSSEVDQDGLAIPVFKQESAAPWPAEGTPVNWSAKITNLGSEALSGLRAQWFFGDQQGPTTLVQGNVASGTSGTTATTAPFSGQSGDARRSPVGIRLLKADGTTLAESEVFSGGLAIRLNVSPEFKKAWKPEFGTIESAFASAIRTVNEEVLPQSRFSVAPDGCVARLNLQEIRETDTFPDTNPVSKVENSDSNFDAEVWLTDPKMDLGPHPELHLIKLVLESLGVPESRNKGEFANDKPGEAGAPPEHPHAGLLGGDSRFDGTIPAAIMLPFEPVGNPIIDMSKPEATGLLSLTQLGYLNAKSVTRIRVPSDWYNLGPQFVFVRCVDFSGRLLNDVTVTVHGWNQNGINPEPFSKSLLNNSASVSIPARAVLPGLKSPTGYFDPFGRNGAVALKVERFGTTDIAWIRTEQIVDAMLRNPGQPAIFDVRFNVSDGQIESTNLAAGKFVSDSGTGLPAQLIQITDGTSEKLVEVKGDWFEIDLGRDRPVGEIRFLTEGMWKEFDIHVYGTGQTFNDSIRWVGERDFGWMWRNRSVPISKSNRYLPYRAAGQVVRYLRFVNKGAKGSAAKVGELQVFGVGRPGG